MAFFYNLFVYRKIEIIFAAPYRDGALAQLVEQWTENPCVPGSIPGGTTLKPRSFDLGFFVLSGHALPIYNL